MVSLSIVELAYIREDNTMFKNFLLLKIFLFISFTAEASPKIQNFEGSINLKKETVYDTSYVTIQVKGDLVRIDELDKNKSLQNSYIVNLKDESVLALSPKRKLYSEISVKENNLISQIDTQIIRTENCMDFNGYRCCQMRVKCKSKNTEVAYWVTQENFDFFTSLVKILRNTKLNIDLFNYFPNINGIFPVLTVERTLLRKEKMKLAVADIKKAQLSESSFRIPPGYRKIEQ